MPSDNDFIWTGNWQDAIAFIDRVGYRVPFLEHPAIYMKECGDPPMQILHVDNTFTENGVHCDVGDTIRWYPTTRSFSVIKTP